MSKTLQDKLNEAAKAVEPILWDELNKIDEPKE
jgi:hypothetical protein